MQPEIETYANIKCNFSFYMQNKAKRSKLSTFYLSVMLE